MPEVKDLKWEAVVKPWSVPFILPFSSFNAVCDQCKTPVMDTFHWARHQRAHNPQNSAALHQTPGPAVHRSDFTSLGSKDSCAVKHVSRTRTKYLVFVVFLCETRRSLATTWNEFDVTLMKHDLLQGGLGGGRGGGGGGGPLGLSGCGLDHHSLRANQLQF